MNEATKSHIRDLFDSGTSLKHLQSQWNPSSFVGLNLTAEICYSVTNVGIEKPKRIVKRLRLQRDANPCQLPEGVSVPDVVKLNTLLVQLRAQRIEASSEVRSDPDSLCQYANNPINTAVPADPHKMFVIGFQEDRSGEYYKFTLCWSTTHLLSFTPSTVSMVLHSLLSPYNIFVGSWRWYRWCYLARFSCPKSWIFGHGSSVPLGCSGALVQQDRCELCVRSFLFPQEAARYSIHQIHHVWWSARDLQRL